MEEEMHVSAHTSSRKLGLGLGRARFSLGQGRVGLRLRNLVKYLVKYCWAVVLLTGGDCLVLGGGVIWSKPLIFN